jgi:hypothetical protein
VSARSSQQLDTARIVNNLCAYHVLNQFITKEQEADINWMHN